MSRTAAAATEVPMLIAPTGSSRSPGSYDPVCLAAFMATRAETAVLIVVDGDEGDGFSVNSLDVDVSRSLPPILRRVADNIEASIPTAVPR